MESYAELLARAVPHSVRAVCQSLADAGHQAVIVGGCVRDVLLGRVPGDWDLATSATPEQVIELFPRTIPTGLDHGTVTVLSGRGAEREAVEVTTFRGEAGYSDGRRPDAVEFGVPLVEDLARRDFVINAIAYDPIRRTVVDPFGGADDLRNRRLRAVGDAKQRFVEDGLRVMRAVRFAACLEFALDPETEAGIAAGLPSLGKVSMERVRDELSKLLAAPKPSIGLLIAERSGIFDVIWPGLIGDDFAMRLAAVDRAEADTIVRLACLMGCSRPASAEVAKERASYADRDGRRLRLSNNQRTLLATLARYGPSWSYLGEAADAASVRRMLSEVGRGRIGALLALWQAQSTAEPSPRRLLLMSQAIVQASDPLSVAELAVTGGELIAELGLAKGPAVGVLLRGLFESVLDDPTRNSTETLLELARELLADLQ